MLFNASATGASRNFFDLKNTFFFILFFLEILFFYTFFYTFFLRKVSGNTVGGKGMRVGGEEWGGGRGGANVWYWGVGWD